MGKATHGRQVSGDHVARIATLAEELHLSVEQVQGAYLQELARLEADARIKSFVSVLALSRIRTELRRQQRPR